METTSAVQKKSRRLLNKKCIYENENQCDVANEDESQCNVTNENKKNICRDGVNKLRRPKLVLKVERNSTACLKQVKCKRNAIIRGKCL